MLERAEALPWVNAEVPFISVVVTVRNEEARIASCLAQIVAQEYPKDRLEIVVADGMSTDRTRQIVESFPTQGIPLRMVPNPDQGRAHGLNVGIRAARGEIIARIDARTVVEPDYLSKCVRTIHETGADNVGGVQRPLGEMPAQQAIGLALSHPFGVGNAQFRLGRTSGFVDTIYPGCFRRDVFERVGLFDEEAPVISEDSDLNYRLRRTGGKVYLNTEITVYYQLRETFGDLWRLYFRYGGARAGTLLKHRSLTSWRQLAPPLFVAAVIILSLATLVDRRFLMLLGAALGAYVILDGAVSVAVALRQRKPWLLGRLCLVFPCMHVAYGLGFWRRLLQRPRLGSYWGY